MITPQQVLDKEGIVYTNVTKIPIGYINDVYDVDDRFILRIGGQDHYTFGMFKPQVDVMKQLVEKGAKVPKVFAYGVMNDKEYMLIEKLRGENLVEAWLTMSQAEQDSVVAQLAEQLRLFQSITYDRARLDMNDGQEYDNFAEAFESCLNLSGIKREKIPAEYQKYIDVLENYKRDHLPLLAQQTGFVLVHRDLHFDQIFCDQGQLTGIIDFDFVSQAPKELELSKILDFVLKPENYVIEQFEELYKHKNLDRVMTVLKQVYPELFANPDLSILLRVYALEHIIEPLEGYSTGRFDQKALETAVFKIRKLYESDWLEKILA